MIDNFFKQFKPLLFRRKETITVSNNLNHIFYLNQGYIRLYTISREGTELTLHIFSPSSVFPILWNTQINEYYFESLTPAEVYSCETTRLQQLIKEKPDINSELIKQLSFFSQKAINKLEFKIFGDAYQQVVATILDLVECFGNKEEKGTVISYWFTHQDIASLTGLSRERVTIEINNLLNKRLISYSSHFIAIPNTESLKSEIN